MTFLTTLHSRWTMLGLGLGLASILAVTPSWADETSDKTADTPQPVGWACPYNGVCPYGNTPGMGMGMGRGMGMGMGRGMGMGMGRVGGPNMLPPRLLFALDKNQDGVLSADELKNGPAALLDLDRNGDGQLTPDELATFGYGPGPGRGRGRGPGAGIRQGQGFGPGGMPCPGFGPPWRR